jgi:hypothetical protein
MIFAIRTLHFNQTVSSPIFDGPLRESEKDHML